MKLLDLERQGVLFPLLVVAAIGVIVLSAVSTAAIVGWLPSAHSDATYGGQSPRLSQSFARDDRPSAAMNDAASPAPPSRVPERTLDRAPPPPPPPTASRVGRAAPVECARCGTVVSIQPVAVSGGSSGLGAIAGGVLGGVLGNQVGGGNGRTIATIAGAGGGAYVGNQVEKGMNQRTRYRVVVRADGGGTRSFTEASARWQPGDRVSIQGDRLESVPAAQ